MKKILLAILILSVATLSFAFNGKGFNLQLQIPGGDIMSYVDTPATPTSPAHDADFILSVKDITADETISTTTHVPALLRVCTAGGPSGIAAWVIFNAQAFATAGPVPIGRQFEVTLTYLGNDDPLTNTLSTTITSTTTSGAIFLYGDDNSWFLPEAMFGAVTPPTHTISGMITSTNWFVSDIVMTATNILPEDIYISPSTGEYTITVPNEWNGIVTPVKAGFIMTPEYREYTNVMDDVPNEDYDITKDVDPLAPVITYPAEGHVFNWEAANTVNITWGPAAGYAPEFYEIKWNNADDWTALAAGIVEWDTPTIGNGDYNFKVRGVINTPRGKSYVGAKAIKANSNTRSAGNTAKGAGDLAEVNFEVIVTDIPDPSLLITSIPTGATVWNNGIELGTTPYTALTQGDFSVTMTGYTFTPANYPWNGFGNLTVEFLGTEDIPVPDIPEGTTVTVNGIGVTMIAGNANIIPWPAKFTMPAFPNPNINAGNHVAVVLELLQPGPWTLQFNSNQDFAAYYLNGMWNLVPETPADVFTYTVPATANPSTDPNPEIATIFANLDPTLPVELSSFNAVLTAQKFVKLTWISESESNMMGYRVYRNETQDAASATLITPVMIPATNTSSTQVYNLEDKEVAQGHTYYYWLEAADYGHSTMYGPSYVEVTVDTTPELPVQTTLKNAYPNPFKANTNTNIEVSVKAGENGTVTIYNVLGQVVQTYKVGEGTHNLKWNGQDTRGTACGSGIYFYKLSTPSKNQTKKMVIVK
jgi:hypothetical protein